MPARPGPGRSAFLRRLYGNPATSISRTAASFANRRSDTSRQRALQQIASQVDVPLGGRVGSPTLGPAPPAPRFAQMESGLLDQGHGTADERVRLLAGSLQRRKTASSRARVLQRLASYGTLGF